MVVAGGTTVVPGMVDAHSHTVLPGGSHWITRIDDATDELLEVAQTLIDNGVTPFSLANKRNHLWIKIESIDPGRLDRR